MSFLEHEELISRGWETMTLATLTGVPASPPAGQEGLFRFDVEQYLEMVRLGIFANDERVELLEGLVVAKMGKEPPHVFTTKRVFAALNAAAPGGWHVAKEDPIRLATSVPEPDCSVI